MALAATDNVNREIWLYC